MALKIIEAVSKISEIFDIDFGNDISPEQDKAEIRCFSIFHNDSKPSFSINEQNKICKCFGCGISGRNSFDFVLNFIVFTYIKYKKIKSNVEEGSKEFFRQLRKNGLSPRLYDFYKKYYDNNQEFQKTIESIEEYIDKNGNISYRTLRENQSLVKFAQIFYRKINNGQNFSYDEIFNEKTFYDPERDKRMKELMNDFYFFVLKKRNNEPSNKLVEYFLSRGINKETLKNRGIIDFDDKILEEAKDYLVEKYKFKDTEVTENLFYEILEEDEHLKNIIKLEYNVKNDDEYNNIKQKIYNKYNEVVKSIKNKKNVEKIDYIIAKRVSGINYLIKYKIMKPNGFIFKRNPIIMPFWDEDRKSLISVQFRSIDPNVPKNFRFVGYGRLAIYNLDILNKYNTIFIFEGGSDANTLLQYGFPATSIPGASTKLNPKEIEYFIGKNIFIVGDNDSAGQKFRERIYNQLKYVANKIELLDLPIREGEEAKDLNEWHQKYNINSSFIPYEEYKKYIKEISKKEYVEIENISKYEPQKKVVPTINSVINGSITKNNDIQHIIDKNDIVSISDNGVYNLHNYLEYIQNHNREKQIVLSYKVKLGNLYNVILMFKTYEEYIKVISNIKNNNISLTELKELENNKNIVIILPQKLNKILSSTKPFKNKNNNVFIGLTLDNLKFVSSNLSYLPIFINDNLYTNKTDDKTYRVYHAVKNNIKLNNYEKDVLNSNSFKDRHIRNNFEILENISKDKDINDKKKQIIYWALKNSEKIHNDFTLDVDKTLSILNNTKPKLPFGKVLLSQKAIDELKKTEDIQEITNIYMKEFKKIIVYIWNREIFYKKYSNPDEQPPICDLIEKEYKEYLPTIDFSKRLSETEQKIYGERISKELFILSSFNNELFFQYFMFMEGLLYLRKKGYVISFGRGSAAGSLIAYLFGITNTDPVKYNLLFERFLDPTRKDYPDIDTNLSPEARKELIEFYKNKYGNVYGISVLNYFRKKKTINYVLRIIGIKEEERNNITKNMDDDEFQNEEVKQKFNEILNKYKGLDKIIDGIEGTLSHIAPHPSAIIIDKKNIADIYKTEDLNGVSLDILNIDQEALGQQSIKYDFLSSHVIEIVEESQKYLKDNELKYDERYMDIDNKDIYRKILEIGFDEIPELDTQNENFKKFKYDLYKKMKVSNINDLAAFISLIRPGASLGKNEYIFNKNKKYFKSSEFQSMIKNKTLIDLNKYKKLNNVKDILKELKNISDEKFKMQFIQKNIEINDFEVSYIKELLIEYFEFLIKFKNRKEIIEFLDETNILKAENKVEKLKELLNNDKYKNFILKYFKGKKYREILELLNKEFEDLYFENKILNNSKYRKITRETYGTIIYQEQIMFILNQMAGFSLEEANKIRRIISKKKTDEIKNYTEKIKQGLMKHSGLDEQIAEFLLKKIIKSSEYAFNKSHAVAYALTTFYMMELKVKYYPIFYLSVKSVKNDSKLKISPDMLVNPKINLSSFDKYIYRNGKIYKPLKTIEILKLNKEFSKKMEENYPFKDFDDFCNKMDCDDPVNEKIIRTLFKSYFFPKWFYENTKSKNKFLSNIEYQNNTSENKNNNNIVNTVSR